jgi:hypothetical protein
MEIQPETGQESTTASVIGPATAKRKRRHRASGIPGSLRKEIRQFAKAIGKRYRGEFAQDPKLKARASRFLKALLPPHARRGRPRNTETTQAISRYRKLRRENRNQRPRELWVQVAAELIPNYESYSHLEQRALVDDLRNRAKRSLRKRPCRKSRPIPRL